MTFNFQLHPTFWFERVRDRVEAANARECAVIYPLRRSVRIEPGTFDLNSQLDAHP
jgi:hypothetical protein